MINDVDNRHRCGDVVVCACVACGMWHVAESDLCYERCCGPVIKFNTLFSRSFINLVQIGTTRPQVPPDSDFWPGLESSVIYITPSPVIEDYVLYSEYVTIT